MIRTMLSDVLGDRTCWRRWRVRLRPTVPRSAIMSDHAIVCSLLLVDGNIESEWQSIKAGGQGTKAPSDPHLLMVTLQSLHPPPRHNTLSAAIGRLATATGRDDEPAPSEFT